MQNPLDLSVLLFPSSRKSVWRNICLVSLKNFFVCFGMDWMASHLSLASLPGGAVEPSIANVGEIKPNGAPPLIALPNRGGNASVAIIL